MKIAGHTMGTPEYSLEDALRLFKKIGLDGAEIIVQDGYRCALEEKTSTDTLRELSRLAKDLSLEIPCLTPYFSRFNDLDEGIREKEIEGMCKVITYAEILGAKYIRLYGGNFGQDERDEDGKKRGCLVESLRFLGEIAKKHGVSLVLENHFNTMTVSARESVDISYAINHPSVGILYDQANLTFTGNEEYETAIPLQFDKSWYVHVKDFVFRGNDHTFSSSDVSHPQEEERKVVTRIVGEGILDWPAILQMLKDRGYSGWLSLEYERRWHPQDIPDASLGMKQSAAFLRKIIRDLK
ncbi:sugar phosphate isomerase/epimerase family protein [Sediminispirochaeta smaragdinae]|uniref:Xylose isomerase domain protein TIM barrel n=1 Tax=Sediminispirochaeta smaragdinae (strain DSM 11293 / JCM 15392 / SEBR 4228) TaxID=573413 RepID=E1RC29_SEDSS|nr:sugar phosphate isomerase/epimerase family protein [Sediminispirochaeta smaragdinae]ADK79909.1 Xylose isomerase domain protein TIM barrel [Sediminispirochaeta smaragdinae DSM 11293]